MTQDDAVKAILAELKRATAKHPNWPNSDEIHGAAIVMEEAGELIRAALQFEREDGSYEACQEEAIQTAAMCIRFLIGG